MPATPASSTTLVPISNRSIGPIESMGKIPEPAAGSAVTTDGTVFNIDVEALAAGDSTLAFDLSNVNIVASDGRPLLLQIEPIKLTVK